MAFIPTSSQHAPETYRSIVYSLCGVSGCMWRCVAARGGEPLHDRGHLLLAPRCGVVTALPPVVRTATGGAGTGSASSAVAAAGWGVASCAGRSPACCRCPANGLEAAQLSGKRSVWFLRRIVVACQQQPHSTVHTACTCVQLCNGCCQVRHFKAMLAHTSATWL